MFKIYVAEFGVLKKIIIICGPTGVGKTKLSIQLAKKLNGEIVVADSQAILKGFDIGTAKPTEVEQKQIPHHLINVAEYGEIFDAAKFSKLAEEAINDIFSRGKQPIISGGTGLYIKAILHGLMDAPKRDDEFRKKMQERIENEGLKTLYHELKKIDPTRAAEIHPNDAARIIRGLELYHLTKSTPSELAEHHQFQDEKYETLKIGLNLPREELYKRIDQRVLQMIEAGWVEEVRDLIQKGYDLIQSRTQTIGYSILAGYLKGNFSFEAAIEQIQKETRQLAKRQLTWFRGDKKIEWFHPTQLKEILKKSTEFLQDELKNQ